MSLSVCQVQVQRTPYEGFLALGGIPVGTALDSRKRTTSFSSPPRKRIHRTESYVDLSFAVSSSSSTASTSACTSVPYPRTLRYYKEQKERRRALLRREPPVLDPSPLSGSSTSRATVQKTPPVSPSPSLSVPTPKVTRQKTTPAPPPTPPRIRSTPPSPLALASASPIKSAVTPPPPVRAPIPVRSSRGSLSNPTANVNVRATSPPRTKVKTSDLHRRAVTACMRASPSGAKILHMGARLAVGIMSATRELERLCGEADSSPDTEGDVSPYGAILDEEMNLEEDADAVGEDDDVDDIDAESVDDEDMLDSDDEGPLQMQKKPLGRLIVPAPLPSSAPALEQVASEGEAMMDVQMPDAPVMSSSWIFVGEAPSPREDWEMVEGA
ncbi:hypothetical protein B0H12DRAFT_1246514 [Mycena haematopus]|nr:hypothetical protein B0H12DRAFT_1246514 [Mycena haematopus]